MPGPLVLPDVETYQNHDLNEQFESWIVVIYDNDYNTWDEVVYILMEATGCTEEEAHIETWEVDNLGKSVVHHGGKSECERVAGVIRRIGMRVEVVQE